MGFTEYIAPKRDRLLTRIARLVLEIGFETIRSSIMLQSYSSSILVRPLLQLLTTTTISWNKTEKIGVMILKVYMRINIVLLIVYPQFGKQSLLAPLIMSGVVRVRVSKSFRLRKEFQPPLRTQALQAH